MAKLTAEQLRRLDQIMGERFTREMEEINAIAARSRDEQGQVLQAGDPPDRLDKALADVALEADYAIVQKDVQDVRDIVSARRRMAAGTYGICVDCGEQIGHERLLAYPTAKRCIGCQREYEQSKAMGETRRFR